MHISPATVEFLRALGHGITRVSALLPPNAADEEIIQCALREDRTILTQDLDFSALIALSGAARPSVISLRLSASRIERVNDVLRSVLPLVEREVMTGAVVTVEDGRIRCRTLPMS